MSNIPEGFERVWKAEFHKFLIIAKGSCAEIRSQLHVALDRGYITNDQFEKVRTLAEEVARIIGGLRASLKRST